jgi:eukaryotic-like serine/threonine-protein kinase
MSSTIPNLTFSELLALSGLLSPEDVRGLRERFPEQTATTEGLTSLLVEQNLITQWQLQKLLKGKYKGFYLGDYKLQAHLAKGGMSTLYTAVHTVTGEQRALKVLPPAKAAQRSYLPRFLREARITAAMKHINIMRVFEVVSNKVGESSLNFMAMELLHGRDLFQVVSDQGPQAIQWAAEIIRQAARGLHYAHQQGLVHRDVKPGNVFLTDTGIVKIIDLGLASVSEDFDETLTQDYNERILGTADYLAPEQAIDSHKADRRADVYGLGCTFYFLLTGQPPFAEGGLAQRLLAHQTKTPDDIRRFRNDVPQELQELLSKMLTKDPDDRIPTAQLVAERLELWLSEHSDKTSALLRVFPPTRDTGLARFARKLKRILPGEQRLVAETPTDSLRSAETQTSDSLSGFVQSSVVALAKRYDACVSPDDSACLGTDPANISNVGQD